MSTSNIKRRIGSRSRSRVMDVKEMYKKEWCTSRAVVLLIKPIVFFFGVVVVVVVVVIA